MNYDDLKGLAKAFAQSRGNTGLSTVLDDGTTGLLGEDFPTLKNVAVAEDVDRVVVSGQAAYFSSEEANVEVAFFLAGEEPHVLITISQQAGWRFGDAFPKLVETIDTKWSLDSSSEASSAANGRESSLDRLVLAEVKWTFASIDSEEGSGVRYKRGWNLEAELDPLGSVGLGVDAVFLGIQPLKVTGVMQWDQDRPLIDLRAVVATPASVGYLGDVAFELKATVRKLDSTGGADSYKASLSLVAGFSIGSNPVELSVDISDAGNHRYLEADLDLRVPGLIDLANVLFPDENLAAALPQELKPAGWREIELSKVRLGVGRSDSGAIELRSVFAELKGASGWEIYQGQAIAEPAVEVALLNPLKSDQRALVVRASGELKDWTIIENVIDLESLYVTLQSVTTTEETSVRGMAIGRILLGDSVVLESKLGFPLEREAWSLAFTGPLAMPDLDVLARFLGGDDLAAQLPPGVGNLGGFTLQWADLQLSPVTQSLERFRFEISSTEPWVLIAQQIELSRLSLDFSIADPTTAERATTGAVRGAVRLFGLNLDASVGREDADEAWRFEIVADDIVLSAEDGLSELGKLFGEDIAALLPDALKERELTLYDLKVSGTLPAGTGGDAALDDATFTLKSGELVLELHGAVDQNAMKWWGTLRMGEHAFDVAYSEADDGKVMMALYRPPANTPISLGSMVEPLSTDLAGVIPDNLRIELKDVLFAHASRTDDEGHKKSASLFAFEMGFELDTGKLPLVGPIFSGDYALRISGLRALLSSGDLYESQIGAINASLPDGVSPIGVEAADESSTEPEITLHRGFHVAANIDWSGGSQPLQLGTGGDTSSLDAGEAPGTPAPAADNGAKWIKLDKHLGPVYLGRVGMRYEDARLAILFDGSLGAGGLSLSLMGLSISTPLTEFKPAFDLDGIGISLDKDAVAISGGFMRKHFEATDSRPAYDEFSGAALIKTDAFTLAAVGAYAKYKGEPSMFIYAVLDQPIGGPSFFFVTGLALGFGYNRKLIVPTVDKLLEFPLVQQAMQGAAEMELTEAMDALQKYIPPSIGEIFFAVGVKFTSFKMIDSFALLTASFGERTELNLLGVSTLVVPTPIPGVESTPLAVMQLAMKATYLPEEGFLGVSAQLTPASYILSKDCRISGGFAFYSWFAGEHEGDFVLSIGGYHPQYKVPDHYPRVPRLEYNWSVIPGLTITGQGYFAMVPSGVMAGGHWQAVWQSGDLRAWFAMSADFFIQWQPYHYDAQMYVGMGVDYTFWFFGTQTISFDIGARMHIWGPEFAGTATVDLDVVAFTIEFGATKQTVDDKIDWLTFKESFVPKRPISIAVREGLVSAGSDSYLGTINPKEFCLVIESAIPISSMSALPISSISMSALASDGNNEFGVAPMGIESMESTFECKITREDGGGAVETDPQVIRKNQPAALWGNVNHRKAGSQLVENLTTGIKLTAHKPEDVDATKPIAKAKIAFENNPVSDAFSPPAAIEFTENHEDEHPLDEIGHWQAFGAGVRDDFEGEKPIDAGYLESLLHDLVYVRAA